MSGYPKALARLGKSSPTLTVDVECTTPGCTCRDEETEFDLTKLDGYRAFIERGWTYDADGRWRCPRMPDRDISTMRRRVIDCCQHPDFEPLSST